MGNCGERIAVCAGGHLIRQGFSAQAQVEKMMLDAFEGANNVYALARDSAKLPPDNQPWRPVGKIDIQLADSTNFGIAVHRIVQDVRRAGFHPLSRHEMVYLLAVVGVRRDPPTD
jgi:hypothetical protein